MYDQSFSAENFRKIFDYENRKGRFLEGRFYPQLAQLTSEIKERTGQLRQVRKNRRQLIAAGTYETTKQDLVSKRTELKAQKETQLMALLEEASQEATKPAFSLKVQKSAKVNGKDIYISGTTPASYFVLKQLQRNLRGLFRVQQGNRHMILCQVREMLRDNLPKYVLRLDFSGFYENIRRAKLRRRIVKDPLLTVASKKLIYQLLWEYGQVSGSRHGVPRGVGLSAYLVELYMREFDEAIRRINGVVYYARYVDDIIVVIVPPPNHSIKDIYSRGVHELFRHRLKLNRTKSKSIIADGKMCRVIDFLGYRFLFGAGGVELRMTKSKIDRYKRRIDLSCSAFMSAPPAAKSYARKLLVQRLKFLTGNTRLLNNKRNALVGSFYSNSLLTSTADLSVLDGYLNLRVGMIADPILRTAVQHLSFELGFKTKRFHRYSVQTLSKIVRVWKYAS